MRFLAILFILLTACSKHHEIVVTITRQDFVKEISFRGLDVVDKNIAWVSGSQGTILRTTDAGVTWEDVTIPEADSIDFRDIETFSANEAIVLSAGSPGLVYLTSDGGKTWDLVYKDLRENIFFDAMDFWDRDNGIAFGDAIDGKVVILRTEDGGKNWYQLPPGKSPDALPNEGGFAASGTCLATHGDSSVWIALGTPKSRILFSPDRGMTWSVQDSQMAQEAPGAGVFSLAFSTNSYGLAIGGNYETPDDTTKIISLTTNGGQDWQLLENHGIIGYRSAIESVPGTETWLCAGPTGLDISTNNGISWSNVDTVGFHTLIMADDKYGWTTGPRGRIGRIEINYK